MTRGRKLLSAVFGFFQTLVYAMAIGKVVQDLNNVPNLMSYCLGFSVGTLLGMWLEERIAIGHAHYGLSPAMIEVFVIGLVLGLVRLRANTTTCLVVHVGYDFLNLLLLPYFPYLLSALL